MDINAPLPYKLIGAGTFARVFKIDSDHVLKRTRQYDEYAKGMLLNDWQKHVLVRNWMKRRNRASASVPFIHQIIGQQDQFWKDCVDLFDGALAQPGFGLFAELIPPLDTSFREALVQRYCPPELQGAVLKDISSEDCLGRIYLGRRRKERVNSKLANSVFSLRNFPLSLDQLEELELPVDELCRTIAEALAIMHWGAKVDARDVEFVLGGPSNRRNLMVNVDSDVSEQTAGVFERDTRGFHSGYEQAPFSFRRPRATVWLLDFNQVKELDDKSPDKEKKIRQAVDAFWTNDPYYPRPNEERVWKVFSDEYLRVSATILNDFDHPWHSDRDLPRKFLSGVELEFQRRGWFGSQDDR